MLVVNLQSLSLVEFQQKWMLVLHMTHTALLGSPGNKPGNKPSYQLAAIQLGNELVERNIDLVYGGGSIGLMGLISQAVYDGGHHVLGSRNNRDKWKKCIGDKDGDAGLQVKQNSDS